MAGFNYTGWAVIQWQDDSKTVQFIDYAADTGTLSVWPADESIQDREYLGSMRDHPAKYMKFKPGWNGPEGPDEEI